MLRNAIMLAAAATAVSAGSLRVSDSRVVVSSRHNAPMPWRRLGRAARESKVDFTVAVPQRNLDQLNEVYEAVTDPTSPRYTDFLTVDEINAIVGNPEAVSAVTGWLAGEGISGAQMRDLADAVLVGGVDVDAVERIFQTEMHVFEHAKSGRRIVRQYGEWSLPASVKEAITFVSGLSDFPADRYGHVQARNADTTGDIVPQSIRKLYSIPDDESASTASSQGVIEFQNAAAFTDADMASFFQGTSTQPQPIPNVVGPFNNQSESVESVLDIQYIVAVGTGANNFYWTDQDWLYTFAVSFANAQNVPSVFSMSYGWSEAQQCQVDQSECSTLGVDSTGFVHRVNTEFQKIGLRGISVLASSGDSGANGRTDGFCTDQQLHPGFPAASPYVTAVGATQIENPTIGQFPDSLCSKYQCIESGTEVAVSYDVARFTSGGGFSNVAPRPQWQQDAVNAYLNSGTELPPASYFNQTGRGYPDISAMGNNFVIVQGGSPTTVGGTSASSPTVAGIIALLNDARLKAGKKVLGPLNPVLYKMFADQPAAFQDVTQGDNKCTEDGCGSGGSCKGFVAAKGWDPVTGLGTPNYAKMKEYVLSLK